MTTNYYRDVWPRCVAHHYDDMRGWMMALTDVTIEIDGEPLHIPRGHRLTRQQALNYAGDVKYVYPVDQAASKRTRLDSRREHAGMTGRL
jgi:hypothetical protein